MAASAGGKVVVRHGRHPQAGETVAEHANQTGGQEVGLESRPELLRRPAAQGTVDNQWRPVHAVGTTQHPCTEPERPRQAIGPQLDLPAAPQTSQGKGDDDKAQNRLDDGLRHRRQEQQPQGNTEQGEKDEPAGTADLDLAPILGDDHAGHRNGEKHGQGGRPPRPA